ncbi:hypothetical protein [Owenweeksia hongkongensis]|uniref:hypothetical protein n=1 Tax=Owenweeksia hongkongensis TaxID=253245 RepID=UPI003A94FCDF
MTIDFDNLDTDELLFKTIQLATKQSPYGTGKVLDYVISSVFFPNIEVDEDQAVWDKIEGKMIKMVDKKVDDAIQQMLGDIIGGSMIRRLRAFGDLFRQLAYINNIEEKKMHLAVLTNAANDLIADINNVPPLYLMDAAKFLKVLAAAHIATIMELKGLEPDSYKHQSALNNMAILYSDTAGGMFHRSFAWRMSMIGEGKGVLHEWDSKQEKTFGEAFQSDKKVVNISVKDKYANGTWQFGAGLDVVFKTTPPIPVDGGTVEYATTKEEVYKELDVYVKKVKDEWTEQWNKTLLTATKGFMKLVDWDGRKLELKGDIPRLPNQLVFPVAPSQSQYHSAGSLERIDLFLEQQMDQFITSGPRYVQTYRPPTAGFPGDHHNVFYRADTYDTSMACIYFIVRGDLQRARDLGDGLVQAMNHDPKGEGRIVAASYANRLVDPNKNYATSIYVPDGGRRDIGNMSWAGIALTRLFHATKTHRYLHAAEIIGQWIITNCTKTDSWKGFTGGEDHWDNKYEWRSVEHNTDCVSFFDNLFALTGNPVWETARESARTLVKACLVQNTFYITGTGIGQNLNTSVIPTDCQSWVSLAHVNPETDQSCLMFMSQMETSSKGFLGTKFAMAGAEIQNEATAGAAMALWFARDKSSDFEQKALAYMDSLERQIKESPNGIGYGVVATPAEVADTGEGLGWQYFNYLHVASSAWTGLALAGKDLKEANPYMSLH